MTDDQGPVHAHTTHIDAATGPGYAPPALPRIEPIQLELTYDLAPADVVAWLVRHGHRAWYAGHAPGADAYPAVMFDSGPDTTARAVLVGNTLTVNADGTVTVS